VKGKVEEGRPQRGSSGSQNDVHRLESKIRRLETELRGVEWSDEEGRKEGRKKGGSRSPVKELGLRFSARCRIIVDRLN